MRALSIRQPFAWAVIYAGKDVENRSAPRRFKAAVGERILIHASSYRMRQDEYERPIGFMASVGVECPRPADLMFGGVIGSALVVDIVTDHSSVWFRGPAALLLADPRPEPFRQVRGQVGLFRVLSP